MWDKIVSRDEDSLQSEVQSKGKEKARLKVLLFTRPRRSGWTEGEFHESDHDWMVNIKASMSEEALATKPY